MSQFLHAISAKAIAIPQIFSETAELKMIK